MTWGLRGGCGWVNRVVFGQTSKLVVLCESLPLTIRQGFNNLRGFMMLKVGYPIKIILG